ncbi:MAG: acetate--CoA ligase family protein [Pseudomonadota bacterium]
MLSFTKIDEIFSGAIENNRSYLLEHELYAVLEAINLQSPTYRFLPYDSLEELKNVKLDSFASDKIVLKVVSEQILHKTEVDGVKIVEKSYESINNALLEMKETIPSKLAEFDPSIGNSLKISGFLLVEFMQYNANRFGEELLVGCQNNREFGQVLTMGAGGTDTEFYAKNFKKNEAIIHASLEVNEAEFILNKLKNTSFYEKISGKTRDKIVRISDEELKNTISAIKDLCNNYSQYNLDAKFTIEEFEINPFIFKNKKLCAIDALCKISKNKSEVIQKPLHKIKNLLEPRSICLIGVSEKMNVGRIILKNIINMGFDKKQIYVIKPGIEEIDEVKCYPSISDLPQKMDLAVISVPAAVAGDSCMELIKEDKTESIILIPGGMGETQQGKKFENQIKEDICESRKTKSLGPVLVGGNCLGILSMKGRFDTLFIPEYKLKKSRKHETNNTAIISQSGAFMITRRSNLEFLQPSLLVSTGNQVDLTSPDFLHYLATSEEIDVIGLYVEGFNDNDGLNFIKLCKESIKAGKKVVFYKGGRTEEGKKATAGHTASMAGNWDVCMALASDAGAIAVDDFHDYEEIIRLLSLAGNKKLKGDRLGVISNAGYECVGFADNLTTDEYKMTFPTLNEETENKLKNILKEAKIDSLVNVKNPIDLTPMANDDVYEAVITTYLESENVDIVIASIVPLTPACKTIPEEKFKHESITSEKSIVQKIIGLGQKYNKPLLVVVDSGKDYDPMIEELEKNNIPVFLSSDRLMKILGKCLSKKS